MVSLPVHHIGLITRHLERSLSVYMALGFEQETEIIADTVQQNRIVFLGSTAPQTMRLELIEPMEGSSVARLPDGWQHICFDALSIPDFEIWFSKQQIGKLYRRRVVAPALGGRIVSFACLRDGSFVEFIHR